MKSIECLPAYVRDVHLAESAESSDAGILLIMKPALTLEPSCLGTDQGLLVRGVQLT
jgi:hypothetical protein